MEVVGREGCVGLDTLPTEILLKIFDHLEVKFITDVLVKVCTLFRDLAEDSSNWRIRVRRRWPGQYPALPPDYPINWTHACTELEEENRLWKDEGAGMLECSNGAAHYASVDVVHVMDSIVVSGSRDHSMNVWSSHPSSQHMEPVSKHADAHAGWIWSLASQDDLLISGAWDSCVKFWKVGATGLTPARDKAQLKTAVLCMDIHENRIVAGTFDNKIVQLDAREDVKRMSYYKSHSRPVLKVKITPTKIYSISEDTNLVIHDRVAGKLYKKLKLPQITENLGQKNYPLSMDTVGNCLYVGDSAGHLNLFDTTSDTAFQFVQSYKTGHGGRLTGVQSGMGAVITSATDGVINIFKPVRDLNLLSSIKLDGGNVVTGISYKNKVLAAATCNNTVYIWRPKSQLHSN
eukprot:TRINITY_DN1509_c0_g1_i1.p1 TRINITY_DN1509_c0_g1~~TRINITY_DN1509_c0_g1_i1.p1  ORF type:complete len:404 (-),score=82.95 TRINITY_DN1509_c0_g1_i1:254-1465(-)